MQIIQKKKYLLLFYFLNLITNSVIEKNTFLLKNKLNRKEII